MDDDDETLHALENDNSSGTAAHGRVHNNECRVSQRGANGWSTMLQKSKGNWCPALAVAAPISY